MDWSVDFSNLDTGHLASLALEQGGTLYKAEDLITTFMAGWNNHATSGLLESDFGSPDFTAAGAPITFGFRTSNTYDPVAGDIDNNVGYDNLVITVTPVPEPAGPLLLAAGALALGRAARGRRTADHSGDAPIRSSLRTHRRRPSP